MTMADTTYVVRVRYEMDKGKAESDANGLASTFDRVAKAMAAAFAVHRILDFSARIVKLQAQFEEMRIGLATMLTGFGAPGFDRSAKGFKDAMSVSSTLMRQVLIDAARLPGTAEELMQVTRSAMPGGIAAGKAIMGPDSVYEMGKRLTSAAHLLQIPGGANTVAREFQAMMEGRAIGRNDLFARIRGMMNDGKGIGAKEFNALSEPGRWKQVDDALKKLIDPALPAYAKTWDAIGHTTANWAQQLARVATSNMFETLKTSLMGLNDWIQKNQSSIEGLLKEMGSSLGAGLGSLFDSMRGAFEFIVANRSAIMPVLQGMAALVLGGKMMGNFGKAGVGNALGGAGLGFGINMATGGSADLQGLMMGVAGGLVQFGGALGTASAAAVAFGAAMNMIDRQRKNGFDQQVERARLASAAPDVMTGYIESANYAIIKQIIQENKLAPGMHLDEGRFQAYLTSAGLDIKTLRGQHLGDVFDTVVARMRTDLDTGAFSPTGITDEQKLLQKLYDKPVPRKPDINLTVNIKQDISQAEDPDRLLVRTKQAIEDGLLRPIESASNRFSILR
jgi:hypothetical protein